MPSEIPAASMFDRHIVPCDYPNSEWIDRVRIVFGSYGVYQVPESTPESAQEMMTYYLHPDAAYPALKTVLTIIRNLRDEPLCFKVDIRVLRDGQEEQNIRLPDVIGLDVDPILKQIHFLSEQESTLGITASGEIMHED